VSALRRDPFRFGTARRLSRIRDFAGTANPFASNCIQRSRGSGLALLGSDYLGSLGKALSRKSTLFDATRVVSGDRSSADG